MIENYANTHNQSSAQTQRVLTYVKNERMGGFVPKYETVKTSDINIAQNIEDSLTGSQGLDTLAYQPDQQTVQGDDSFGFADLIDMVNPLHHIPVVGHVYREITGDEIKPISKIVGAAAFGGPLGVATALADTVITHETGKDMAGNAFDIAFGNRDGSEPKDALNDPENAIQTALNTANDPDMASTLLAFSDLGAQNETTLKFQAYKNVENNIHTIEPRESITKVSFSPKGGLYSL